MIAPPTSAIAIFADVAPPINGVESESVVGPWAVAFVATIVIELAIVAVILRLRARPGPIRPWLVAALVGNVISQPVASAIWFLLPISSALSAVATFSTIEFGVFVFEALVYRYLVHCSRGAAAGMAFATNAVTTAIAVVLLFVR